MRAPTYLLVLLAFVIACDSQGDAVPSAQAEGTAAATAEGSANAALSGDVLIEEHPGGSITWLISGDGKVKALVEVAQKPVTKNVSGDLLFKAKGGAKKVDMKAEADSGLLVAAGPKLEHDLTPIDYNLSVEGKPWQGTLHIPPGGTAELVANAKATAEAGFEGKVGPHGGVIQVVGKDILEIVAIDGKGEIRVYLLGPSLEVQPIGERKITLAVQVDSELPRVVVLRPEAELGLYASGRLKLDGNPGRITIAVRPPDVDLNAKASARAKVALVGLRPGLRIKVGAKAPRLKIMVKAKAVADYDAKIKADFESKLDAKAKLKAKAGVKGKATAKVKAPDVKVKKKASASAGGGSAKAEAGVKIGF